MAELNEYLDAFHGEVAGNRYPDADAHRGAGYNIQAGVSAQIFLRQEGRMRAAFRQIRLDTASGPDFLLIADRTFGEVPRADSPGVGSIRLVRATTAAGAGTIWKGTRLGVVGTNGQETTFKVSADHPVGASDTALTVDITAVEVGPEVVAAGAQIKDLLWDLTWTVQRLHCSAGTPGETRDEFLDRKRVEYLDSRTGYQRAIIDACHRMGGAHQVALFDGGTDAISRCYVGDASYEADADLVDRCRIAVDSARVLGCDLAVYGMTRVTVDIAVSLGLWSGVNPADVGASQDQVSRALRAYFEGRTEPFTYNSSAMRGAIQRAIQGVRTLTIVPSVPERTLEQAYREAPIRRFDLRHVTVNIHASDTA